MDRVALVGWAMLALALAGYVIGVVAPYPGRSVTLPGLMVGIALAAIGSGGDSGTGSESESGSEDTSESGSASGVESAPDAGPGASGSETP